MRRANQIVALGAARLYTPLAAAFALVLLLMGEAGSGIGFVAALAFSLALLLHALVFGARAARMAAPPLAMRLALGLGLIAATGASSTPGFAWSQQITEAGLFLIGVGATSLLITTFFGRAPSLRDEEW